MVDYLLCQLIEALTDTQPYDMVEGLQALIDPFKRVTTSKARNSEKFETMLESMMDAPDGMLNTTIFKKLTPGSSFEGDSIGDLIERVESGSEDGFGKDFDDCDSFGSSQSFGDGLSSRTEESFDEEDLD